MRATVCVTATSKAGKRRETASLKERDRGEQWWCGRVVVVGGGFGSDVTMYHCSGRCELQILIARAMKMI